MLGLQKEITGEVLCEDEGKRGEGKRRERTYKEKEKNDKIGRRRKASIPALPLFSPNPLYSPSFTLPHLYKPHVSMTSLVVDGIEFLHHGDDVVHLTEEPRVDAGEGPEVLHGVGLTVVECGCHGKDTLVRRISELLSMGEGRGRITIGDNLSEHICTNYDRKCFVMMS